MAVDEVHIVLRFASGLLGIVTLLVTTAVGQTLQIDGLIKARNGDTMIVQTSDSPNLNVLLTDDTKVGQVQGVFKARRKSMSMAALIPGLNVKIEGEYNNQSQVVAISVSFKGNDLKQAESIQAGLHETRTQAESNKAELEKQNAELKMQNEALEKQQQQIVSNKTAIDAAIARFGQLDDYYIFDELTINFDNGQVNVNPMYIPQLLTIAEKAKTINGYVIEVKGYASSSGSAGLNQQLSEDRANEVTKILTQQGHIPMTRMLAPGAMGENHQIGNDKTAEGQAQNRRVVVRVLQNKGIAGI